MLLKDLLTVILKNDFNWPMDVKITINKLKEALCMNTGFIYKVLHVAMYTPSVLRGMTMVN